MSSRFYRDGDEIIEHNPDMDRHHIPIQVNWKEMRKKTTTKMVEVIEPFDVVTKEGTMHCEDGFLALDAAGDPYPIAREIVEETYEPAN